VGKPIKHTVTHYEYNELIQYIEKKYKISTDNYYRDGSVVWPGEGEAPYANFWHWVLELNENVCNGCYISLPEDYPWGEVKLDPDCYTQVTYPINNTNITKYSPQFVVDILGMLVKEFGDEILGEKLWCWW